MSSVLGTSGDIPSPNLYSYLSLDKVNRGFLAYHRALCIAHNRSFTETCPKNKQMLPQLGNIIFIVLLGKLRFRKIKFLGHGTQINHQTEAKHKWDMSIFTTGGGCLFSLLCWLGEKSDELNTIHKVPCFRGEEVKHSIEIKMMLIRLSFAHDMIIYSALTSLEFITR